MSSGCGLLYITTRRPIFCALIDDFEILCAQNISTFFTNQQIYL